MSKRPFVLVLAAGKGTRMRSHVPKVLHTLSGQPLLRYVTNTAEKLSPRGIVLVVGYKAAMVRKAMGPAFDYVRQRPQKGTGHAVMQAHRILASKRGHVVVLSGDVPMISGRTLRALYRQHTARKADATVLSVDLQHPDHYGRIVRGARNQVVKIVEDKDASAMERRIREINTGIYCFRIAPLFRTLAKIQPKNRQNEYYLTDVIELLIAERKKVRAVKTKSIEEVAGVNTREDLRKMIHAQ